MLRSISIIVALAMAGPLSAQHRHDAVGNGTGSPREIGQASFAALAEIVAILRADTSTDWASVDLAALRRRRGPRPCAASGRSARARR